MPVNHIQTTLEEVKHKHTTPKNFLYRKLGTQSIHSVEKTGVSSQSKAEFFGHNLKNKEDILRKFTAFFNSFE